MKRYEGLFILKSASREEGIKEIIDNISAEIIRLGGKIETVQKMDRRSFSRVRKKANNAGFFVNFILEIKPEMIVQLRSRFTLSEDVFRVLFTEAPSAKSVVVETP